MSKAGVQKLSPFGKRLDSPGTERNERSNPEGPSSDAGQRAPELGVASLRPTENNSIPRVKFNSPQLKGLTELMLDTGAEPNLIKVSTLSTGITINAKDCLILQDITEGRVETLGSNQIKISGKSVEIHVVPHSFLIATEGLLEHSFEYRALQFCIQNGILFGTI